MSKEDMQYLACELNWNENSCFLPGDASPNVLFALIIQEIVTRNRQVNIIPYWSSNPVMTFLLYLTFP